MRVFFFGSSNEFVRGVQLEDGIYLDRVRQRLGWGGPALVVWIRCTTIRRSFSNRDLDRECHRLVRDRPGRDIERSRWTVSDERHGATVRHAGRAGWIHHFFIVQSANAEFRPRWGLALCGRQR